MRGSKRASRNTNGFGVTNLLLGITIIAAFALGSQVRAQEPNQPNPNRHQT